MSQTTNHTTLLKGNTCHEMVNVLGNFSEICDALVLKVTETRTELWLNYYNKQTVRRRFTVSCPSVSYTQPPWNQVPYVRTEITSQDRGILPSSTFLMQ